jgi:hypothetical protein
VADLVVAVGPARGLPWRACSAVHLAADHLGDGGAAGPAPFLVASASGDGRTYSVSDTSSSCIDFLLFHHDFSTNPLIKT